MRFYLAIICPMADFLPPKIPALLPASMFYGTIPVMLDTIRKNIDLSLLEFIEKSNTEYRLEEVHPFLFACIKEFLLRKGKRIRPLLLILSYQGYRKKKQRLSKHIYAASICIELLHNFMLVHDDIIDCSALRRNKPTMHRMLRHTVKSKHPDKLGIDLGIIAGDIIYAMAMDAFLSFQESPRQMKQALHYFIQTTAMTALGEFIDTLNGALPIHKVTEDDVFLNYSLKTARYTFECPLVMGAMLAGANDKEIQHLATLGLLTGQAFQIQDDIIGVFDQEKNIGKSIFSDIEESKKTILVCHAYATLKGNERKKFLHCFSKEKISHADLKALKTIFITSGSLGYAFDHIRQRLEKSETILNALSMSSQYKELIRKSLSHLFSHTQRIAQNYKLDI